MFTFTNESMYEIYTILKNEIQKIKTNETISFTILNPDYNLNSFAGSAFKIGKHTYIYRGYKAYTDLAESLYSKMLTPIVIDENIVKIRFYKLNVSDSFHKSEIIKEEKYGKESSFFNLDKNEEPSFLVHYLKALQSVDLSKRVRILNLGINKADEFSLIKKVFSNYKNNEFVGVDFCESAIAEAKQKCSEKNFTFYTHDINDLDSLNLGKFDLIITIGTLQSSNLEFKQFFGYLVQNYLKKNAAMILGFPNCRWYDGELITGARMKNYSYNESSNLFKDVTYCKKYLQQKKFRVTITGKSYIFITATSINKTS